MDSSFTVNSYGNFWVRASKATYRPFILDDFSYIFRLFIRSFDSIPFLNIRLASTISLEEKFSKSSSEENGPVDSS
jgi:hypothetical protein